MNAQPFEYDPMSPHGVMGLTPLKPRNTQTRGRCSTRQPPRPSAHPLPHTHCPGTACPGAAQAPLSPSRTPPGHLFPLTHCPGNSIPSRTAQATPSPHA
eukprot:353086-Chlamydomonas_euryale.AAC.1